MKRIWNLLLYGKWKNKLSVQMGMLILATNLLFLSLVFFFLYEAIGNVLQENYEEANLKRFEQAEYNIAVFCEQIERISVRLSAENNLNLVAKNNTESTAKRTIYLQRTIENLQKEINNYAYIESIIVFGQNGTILSCDKTGDHKTNYFYSKEDINDSYYLSDIYKEMKERDRKLYWFGGYTIKDFGVGTGGKKGDERYYIVAVRNTTNGMGQLLINFSMEYFLDIFYVNHKGTSENIYVLDENNCIVASKYKELIGVKKEFDDGEKNQTGISRYMEDSELGKMQVMKYDLPAMGWYLVDEIPLDEIMKERIYLRNLLLFSSLLSAVASFGFSMYWVIGLIRPLQKLMDATKKVGGGDLGYTIEKVSKNEIGILTENFNGMSLVLREMFLKNQQTEVERRNFEMESLRAQINPHLIYNTLNTIKWMAIINGEKGISESIALLSEFLEPVFKNSSPMCTIKEELDYVKKYVDIMNLRIMGGYVLKIEVPEEYLGYKVIRFLMQPIVENAILHGMKDRTSGEICISMWAEAGDGFLQIRDDGSGIEAAVLDKLAYETDWAKSTREDGRVGITNVNRRIKNQYGEEYGLTIQNGKEKGTVVTLRIQLESEKQK